MTCEKLIFQVCFLIVKMEVAKKKRTVKMPDEEKKKVVKMPVEEGKKKTVKMPVEKRILKMPVVEKVNSKIIPEIVEMAEAEEEPLSIKKIHTITLQKFTHESRTYYLDSERDKLYEYVANKKHGKYIGRWDSHLGEIITNAENSDED